MNISNLPIAREGAPAASSGTNRISENYIQLFTVAEALVRLGQNHQTGELMILNNQESVQIFVENGYIIHAHGAGLSGEEAIKHGLDLEAANFVWIAGAVSLSKDTHIDIRDYLLRRSLARDEFPEQTFSAQRKETLALPRKATPSTLAPEEVVDVLDAGFYLVGEKAPYEKMMMNKTVNLIGREIYCDWVINDLRVSRKHCLLQLTRHGVLVRDLGTINGTYVNGKVVGDSYLKVHDKLSLGGYSLTLKRETPPCIGISPATLDKHATRSFLTSVSPR